MFGKSVRLYRKKPSWSFIHRLSLVGASYVTTVEQIPLTHVNQSHIIKWDQEIW